MRKGISPLPGGRTEERISDIIDEVRVEEAERDSRVECGVEDCDCGVLMDMKEESVQPLKVLRR